MANLRLSKSLYRESFLLIWTSLPWLNLLMVVFFLVSSSFSPLPQQPQKNDAQFKIGQKRLKNNSSCFVSSNPLIHSLFEGVAKILRRSTVGHLHN